MTQEELNEYNTMIRKWSAMVRRKILGNTLKLRKGKSGTITRGSLTGKPHLEYKLKDNLLYNPRYFYGQIDSVSYSFERHGVFVHKGVGRGYIVVGNTVVRGRRPGNALKKLAKANGREAQSVILSGPVRRQPVDWFNIIIDKNVPELADKIAELNANAAVNAIHLRIV